MKCNSTANICFIIVLSIFIVAISFALYKSFHSTKHLSNISLSKRIECNKLDVIPSHIDESSDHELVVVGYFKECLNAINWHSKTEKYIQTLSEIDLPFGLSTITFYSKPISSGNINSLDQQEINARSIIKFHFKENLNIETDDLEVISVSLWIENRKLIINIPQIKHS